MLVEEEYSYERENFKLRVQLQCHYKDWGLEISCVL